MIKQLSDKVSMITIEDPTDELFEARYPVPEGVTYNSYIIKDDKTAVMETMDTHVTEQWRRELLEALDGTVPDYLIVHHMEPDHSANIMTFMQMFPSARIVTSAKAQKMLDNFTNTDTSGMCQIVKEGDVLDLGEHKLNFIEAVMVHWPEVLFSYDPVDKALYSADGFGRFGPADPSFDWLSGARRYYFNIVGKFGMQVQKVLGKASKLDIARICPIHGPVLDSDLGRYIALYDTWSSYQPETDGVAVIYSSFYGNTRKAAEYIDGILTAKGVQHQVVDLVHQDVSYALEAAFRYSRMILAAPSYEGGLAPQMDAFLHDIAGKKFQKRKVSVIENGSFGPVAGKFMLSALGTMTDVEVVGGLVTIVSAMSKDNEKEINELVDGLLKA